MPIVKCKKCARSFYTKPNWLKKGNGKYCSIKCRGEAARKGRIEKCFVCSKGVYKSLKDIKKSKSKKYFCSRVCSLQWHNSQQVGDKHGNWKNGSHSYRNILSRIAPQAICLLCKKKDKRILTVHHIDRNRLNNMAQNLAWLCYNCHFLVHHYSEIKNKFDVARSV